MNTVTMLLTAVICLSGLLVLAASGLAYMGLRSSQSTKDLVGLIDRQAQLIASKDPMTYQALRAADAFHSYDETSSKQEATEETDNGEAPAEDDYLAGGRDPFAGDPFISGDLSRSLDGRN